MILDLLILNLIVVLIFNSGFPYEIDEMISKWIPLHHLPEKPFLCVLCSTFWVSIIYLLIVGKMSLLGVLLCLISATFTSVTTPLVKTIEMLMLKVLEEIGEYFNL